MKQLTAMQDLRQDLVESIIKGKEALDEIKDVNIKSACKTTLEKTISTIIERIDTELLGTEKDNITDAYVEGCRKGFNEFGEDAELYFTKTFTNELP